MDNYRCTDLYAFKLAIEPEVTTKHIVALVDALHAAFGQGYVFVPEPITEGGLKLVSWPGHHVHGAYKTIRLRMFDAQGEWPRINDATLAEWRNLPAETIWGPSPTNQKHQVKGTLGFKAFYGAPCWTPAELALIQTAFITAGFTCTGKIPSAAALSTPNETLGAPQ